MHGADDRTSPQHDNGLNPRDGPRQRPTRGVRAARTAAAEQELYILRHGARRWSRQLNHHTFISIKYLDFYLKKTFFRNSSTMFLTAYVK